MVGEGHEGWGSYVVEKQGEKENGPILWDSHGLKGDQTPSYN